MHYVTHSSHRMEKEKFGVTCPDALFVKAIVVPREHEKVCIDVSCPVRTEIPYVTDISHKMQKHKYSANCSDALFVKSVSVPIEHDKYCVDVSCPGHPGMH
jgi:hypothetical protein